MTGWVVCLVEVGAQEPLYAFVVDEAGVFEFPVVPAKELSIKATPATGKPPGADELKRVRELLVVAPKHGEVTDVGDLRVESESPSDG